MILSSSIQLKIWITQLKKLKKYIPISCIMSPRKDITILQMKIPKWNSKGERSQDQYDKGPPSRKFRNNKVEVFNQESLKQGNKMLFKKPKITRIIK